MELMPSCPHCGCILIFLSIMAVITMLAKRFSLLMGIVQNVGVNIVGPMFTH